MIIAVLFNSDDPKFDGYYGPPIRDMIFKTSVLQKSDRHMQVRHGDVLILSNSETRDAYVRLAEDTYFHADWSLTKAKRIRATYLRQTIWAWVIQNVTREIAEMLDAALSKDSSYLGLHSVDYAHPSHLLLYRKSLIHYCRILGDTCMLSYAMGEEEEKDEYEAEAVLAAGFKTVKWEDRGARDTIFDDYDTLAHFQKVQNVKKIFALTLFGEEFAAEELVMMLQDQHPELFTILSETVDAVSRVSSRGDIAEVRHYVLCYVEQLADVLSLPGRVSQNAQRITEEEFRSRLTAYIDKAIISLSNSGHQAALQRIDVDRLLEHINSISQEALTPPRASRIFFYLAKISLPFLQLGSSVSYGSYSAFSEQIYTFSMRCLREPLAPSS